MQSGGSIQNLYLSNDKWINWHPIVEILLEKQKLLQHRIVCYILLNIISLDHYF